MNEKPVMALIIAKPGPLRNSLFSLMMTLPQIDLVAESKDMTSLLNVGSQIQPDLIIVELGFQWSQILKTICYIKHSWSSSQVIVLVDDITQQQTAEEAGADVVLFKGFRASKLIGIIENLLKTQEPENTQNAYKLSSLHT